MITASDILEKLENSNQCPEIDKWIEDVLVRRFLHANARTVDIYSDILRAFNWSNDGFIKAMTVRGFHVEYYCDDRPCSNPYFIISLQGIGNE